jgi:hypothetical protein
MWVGIAFGGLVGVMLLFVLAYCFLHCITMRPHDKRIKSPYQQQRRAKDEEEAGGDDSATVGARSVRRRGTGAEETRVHIKL